MPPRLSAPARREQLLDVALEVFAARGFFGTSMNDVADAAGVTKPVLYQHFESKRELYMALLETVGTRLIDAIAGATTAAEDGKAQTAAGIQAYFRWVHDDRDQFKLLFGSGARRDDEFAEAIRRVEDASAEAIAPLIAADIDDTHRQRLAHGLVGLVEGVSRRMVADGADFDPDQVASEVTDLAWAGLRAVHRP